MFDSLLHKRIMECIKFIIRINYNWGVQRGKAGDNEGRRFSIIINY